MRDINGTTGGEFPHGKKSGAFKEMITDYVVWQGAKGGYSFHAFDVHSSFVVPTSDEINPLELSTFCLLRIA